MFSSFVVAIDNGSSDLTFRSIRYVFARDCNPFDSDDDAISLSHCSWVQRLVIIVGLQFCFFFVVMNFASHSLFCFLTMGFFFRYSKMAPRRVSKRIQRKKQAAQVTPSISNVSRKRKTRNSVSSSRNSVSSSLKSPTAASNDQQRSLATPKSTPASSRIVKNPYAKKKPPPAQSTHASPSGKESLSENDSSKKESSSFDSSATVAQGSLPTQEETATLPQVPPLSATARLPARAPNVPLFEPNTLDGSIDFSAIGAPPKSDFTLTGILASIADNGPVRIGPNILAADMGDLFYNTEEYEKAKTTMVNRFFQTLVDHPQAYPLADMIPDPEDPTTKKRRLYILCRAPKAPNKHFLLNRALIIFSMKHVKVSYRGKDLSEDPQLFADAQYEPDTAQTAFKMLFSRFNKEGITYSQSKDFNGKGKQLLFLLHVGRFRCRRSTLLFC